MTPSETGDGVPRWESEAAHLSWAAAWSAVLGGQGRDARWFGGATLNVAANCLDRHVAERSASPAVFWEGEPGDRRTLSYGDLHAEVCAFAAGLTDLGIGPGDRVAVYAGLVPECVVAMLACARIGAVHAVISTSLPGEALADRLGLIRPRLLVTQDGAWRHGTVLPLKARADEAQSAFDGIENTVVVRRTGLDVEWFEGDHWYHEVLAARPRQGWPAPAAFPSEHPLVAMSLPNPGGSSKLVVLGSGGFLVFANAYHRRALTLGPADVVWVASEIGWLPAQSHGIYGPLSCGATTVLYEGMLDTPTPARTWEIIDRYAVNALHITPTVVRRLREWAAMGYATGDAASLRLVTTAGEPIGPKGQAFLAHGLGANVEVVSDAWGQTELGGMTVFRPPPQGPGSLPEMGLDIVDPHGVAVAEGEVGEVVVRHPWPALFVGYESADSPDRCWRYGDAYSTLDLARRGPDDSFAVLGRTDDLVKVSGQFVSLREVAETLMSHPNVADVEVAHLEAGDDPAILAGVVLAPGVQPEEGTRKELLQHLADTLGGLARPELLVFVEAFPRGVSPPRRRLALQRIGETGGHSESITLAEVRAALG